MSKYSTWVQYKSGRTEILYHKNKPDMELQRDFLKKMPTVSTHRTPTKQDILEMK